MTKPRQNKRGDGLALVAATAIGLVACDVLLYLGNGPSSKPEAPVIHQRASPSYQPRDHSSYTNNPYAIALMTR